MVKVEAGFWSCCNDRPSKIVAFDDDRVGAPKGALVWHYACPGCASTVEPSRVQDAPVEAIHEAEAEKIKVETWAVTWVHEGALDKPFASKCVLKQGSSTMADIPKGIAIKRGHNAADIQLTRLELLGVHYE